MDFTASSSALGIDLNQIPPPDLLSTATPHGGLTVSAAFCSSEVAARVNSELCPSHDLRKHTVGDNSFGAPIAYSNLHNGSAFEDMMNHTQSLIRSFEESLRDFISEWRDVLKDGWQVELRQLVSSSEVYAVYCAPDGNTFYSLSEVACYLRQMSGHNSMESEIRNEKSGRPQPTRKRKSTKTPVANVYCNDPPSDGLSIECASVGGNIQKPNEAEIRRKEDGHSGPEQSALLAEVSDAKDSSESLLPGDGSIPEWAMELEHARKLPTNVGTRIRRCIYNALEKNPPEWAKKILVHSISKGVFKGNASGPTKRAVLSVLANVSDEGMQQKPPNKRRK